MPCSFITILLYCCKTFRNAFVLLAPQKCCLRRFAAQSRWHQERTNILGKFHQKKPLVDSFWPEPKRDNPSEFFAAKRGKKAIGLCALSCQCRSKKRWRHFFGWNFPDRIKHLNTFLSPILLPSDIQTISPSCRKLRHLSRFQLEKRLQLYQKYELKRT